ncbi:hypothetical protein KGQ27_03810 [Patescibacteria group bacterium]|nr:hypothetical protein [Patescibacteria group bacterium]
MGVLDWLGKHWFEAIQSAGIIAGLALTALALRQDAKVRRISNLIAITAHHRDIWNSLSARPALARVLDAAADLERTPLSTEEELFAHSLILHLYSVHCAIRVGVYPPPEGLRKDIAAFFALPIPRAVWEKFKPLQDRAFIRFVETGADDSGECSH